MKSKRLREKSSAKLYEPSKSIFSKIAFWLIISAIGIQLYLGLRHVGDSDVAGSTFGTMCLIEALIGGVGLFFTDIIRDNRFPPKNYRKITLNTIIISFATFIVIAIVQLVIFAVPLTIRDEEMAFAIAFAAPVEEVFFRAFILSIFVRFGYDDEEKIKIPILGVVSIIEILGFGFSAIAFAALHVNYYGDFRLLLVVFIGGIILAIVYWRFRDLTACIFAHFMLNLIVVYQNFFILNL